MNIKNLNFFDNNGFNLNFDYNEVGGYWEGSIYLPKVSVGLYANTTIYILENVNDVYCFPMGDKGDTITFTWDVLNKFVDEFFMFNFEHNYRLTETSALTYTPNDGPDCETLIINRFDEYEIPLDNYKLLKALPVYVAFSANENENATTYNRTLMMSYNGQVIAKIKYFAETVEEDERLKIWNSNLGYNITPEDTMIFYKSDIKECKPDYQLLNEKRKELMMEGSNIYPYIGSYKAIINAIKFFGYDNLGIIEYWKNINPNDENFGKIYHSSRYSLTNKETLTIGARTISLPNKDYKKNNQLALVYSINTPTKEVDEWELPKVEEKFTYTIEEALIKLFALRKKLNKEFMPGTSRIIDVIGEANYFGIQALQKINMDCDIQYFEKKINVDFDIFPNKYVHLTDDRYFNKYIVEKKDYIGKNISGDDLNNRFNVIKDIYSKTISEMIGDIVSLKTNEKPSNIEKSQLYIDYYNEVFVDHTRYDVFEDTKDDIYHESSAKVVLSNITFGNMTFGECDIDFGYKFDSIIESYVDGKKVYNLKKQSSDGREITFGNIDAFGHNDIRWVVKMSNNQEDDELKNIGISKSYIRKPQFIIDNEGTIEDINKLYIELPYIGYYDVTLYVDGYKKTMSKCIKVEPYQLELKGFYYDARNLYDISKDSDMYHFIQDKLNTMTLWAVTERTGDNQPENIDYTMPIYDVEGNFVKKGPYYSKDINEEWYIADNVAYSATLMIPDVKNARYIRNGVDVKPYTWFILGYEYSKIVGKINPKWTMKNNVTGEIYPEYEGKYFTCLLKEEGNYTVTLKIDDNNGNKYEVSRNIIVVDRMANYNLYQTFKKEYDYMLEQKQLALAKDLQELYRS